MHLLFKHLQSKTCSRSNIFDCQEQKWMRDFKQKCIMDKGNKKVVFHTKMMVSFNKVNSAKPNPSAAKTSQSSVICCCCENKCCLGRVNKQSVQGLRSEILTNENHKALTSLLFHTVRIRAGDKIDSKIFSFYKSHHFSEAANWLLFIKGSKFVLFVDIYPWSWVVKHSHNSN